jgi:acetyl-CoA synthetase
MPPAYSWTPDQDRIASTTLTRFLREHRLRDKHQLLEKADQEAEWFWDSLLRFFDVRFSKPYDRVLDISSGIQSPQWCVGGELNLIESCLTRHCGTAAWDKPAIIWEGEDSSERVWSFAQLAHKTSEVAGFLSERGVSSGDVVGLYLPMAPEAAAAFLAVSSIGAIAMPLFSGFGEVPLKERLAASRACAVITADGTRRRGKVVDMKSTLDRAADGLADIHTVVVFGNTRQEVAIVPGRDFWWDDIARESGGFDPQPLPAETPAMLMFTSGTTGKPKGTIHTQCGLLGKNALDMGLCIDLGPEDRLLWMSDMGWIVGPKVIISCTMLGATMVLVEGAPDFPDVNRLWRLVERHKVTMLGLAPTLVRQYMNIEGLQLERHDIGTLRATISSGEPWTETAWNWLFHHVCKNRIPILNYAGGTECGGAILIGTHHDPMRPASFGGPAPGMGADIVDQSGQSAADRVVGELVLRRPSIGLSRGLWEDPEGFLQNYWKRFPDLWVQGDLAMRDEAGLWYLLGRSDDTIKIAGKRTGPAEIESLILSSGLVAEVAVVGIPDPVTGSALACICVAKRGDDESEETRAAIGHLVAERYGRPYRPSTVLFVDDLPKTRNQKIVRRAIRAALLDEDPGDLGAIGNLESIDSIRSAKNKYSMAMPKQQS